MKCSKTCEERTPWRTSQIALSKEVSSLVRDGVTEQDTFWT
jgi:hypothetical protein